jgi:hypothetical protein
LKLGGKLGILKKAFFVVFAYIAENGVWVLQKNVFLYLDVKYDR